MRWSWVVLALAYAGGLACGSPQQGGGSSSVVVVPEPAGTSDDPGPVPSAERDPTPTDPLDYFLGDWDGVMDGRWNTRLTVRPEGSFSVRYVPRPGEESCVMAGKLRVSEERLWLDVERNTCQLGRGPEVLERPIADKADDTFTLRSPDGQHVYRYSRR